MKLYAVCSFFTLDMLCSCATGSPTNRTEHSIGCGARGPGGQSPGGQGPGGQGPAGTAVRVAAQDYWITRCAWGTDRR